MAGKPRYPSHLSPLLLDLLGHLLQCDVTRRLGCMHNGARDVKEHPFFSTLAWDALADKTLPACYLPPVSVCAPPPSRRVWPTKKTKQKTASVCSRPPTTRRSTTPTRRSPSKSRPSPSLRLNLRPSSPPGPRPAPWTRRAARPCAAGCLCRLFCFDFSSYYYFFHVSSRFPGFQMALT